MCKKRDKRSNGMIDVNNTVRLFHIIGASSTCLEC
jgi:hypothetical protein